MVTRGLPNKGFNTAARQWWLCGTFHP